MIVTLISVRIFLFWCSVSNRDYTWANTRKAPSMALLDRFFISDDIEDKYPISKVFGLPYMYSDHCPIILSCEQHRLVNMTFKFEKMWLVEPSFSHLVINKWNVMNSFYICSEFNSAKTFVLKIRNLRLFLKNWNKNVFGSINIKKKESHQ